MREICKMKNFAKLPLSSIFFILRPSLLILTILLGVSSLNSQSLTISDNGEKGTKGLNWNMNGENPVIISTTGNAIIHPSVIEKLLNNGLNVTIINNGGILIESEIRVSTFFHNPNFNLINEDVSDIIFSPKAKINSNQTHIKLLIQTKGNILLSEFSQIINKGGDIRLQAINKTETKHKTPSSKIILGGLISTSSDIKGGKIIIESDTIQIKNSSRLLSRGNFGGGSILIGGDWQGGADFNKSEPNTIYQAISVNMETGSEIDASATENGNGGKIVLWSNLNHPNSSTHAKGRILALGKGMQGKGGMIETSGGSVNFEGINVSTITTDGSAGEWLLDPWNFYFNSTQLSTLATNLGSNNITISTANSSSAGSPSTIYGSGHIVFQAALSYSGSNARTLTLSSNEDIWINNNITSTGGGLSLVFNAASGKRVLIDGDITTNGGDITVYNNATIHFQKTSGLQAINTNNGAINFGNSNIKLLRHSGTLSMNTGNGQFNLGGSGTVEQVNTYFSISSLNNLISGWGGAHVFSLRTYGINVVSGREYTTRLYFWDSWDNETGELFINDNGTARYYFVANRTIGSGGNEMSNISANYGTQYSVAAPSHSGRNGTFTDLYVDITFVAQHSGTLTTWNNLNEPDNNESMELYQLWETQFPQTTYSSGSRSLELITNSGQLNGGSKNFSELASLTLNTNNNSGIMGGIISSTTNVIKSGTGTCFLTQNNTYSGSTTLNEGTLVLQNNAPNPSNKTFNGIGQLRIEPVNTSFTSAFSTTGWSFNSTLTGLTLGKVGNTANITSAAALSINGAITMHGGQVDIQQNLTSAGAILLKAISTDILVTGSITNNSASATTLNIESLRNIRLATNASITSSISAMNTQLWADNDKNGDGIVYMESSQINTGGGSLTIGKNGETALISGSTVRVGGDLFLQRGSTQTITTLGGVVDIYGETILANTSGLSINSSNGNVNLFGVLNSGNQYTLVNNTSGITWDNARIAATSGAGNLTGNTYLATITSRLENTIASQTANYNSSWLGGRRVINIGTDNLWRWIAGPEGLMDGGRGLAFSSQSATGGASSFNNYFNNWSTSEPNNWTGSAAGALNTDNESALQFTGNQGAWNDLPFNSYNLLFYIIETNAAASPVTINSGTGTVTIEGSVGLSKELASLNITSSATSINGAGIITTGTQTYSSSLTVNNNSSATQVLLKAGGTGITSTGNQNIYGGTITVETNLTSTSGNILLDAEIGSQVAYTGDGVSINSNNVVTANNGSITIIGRGGNGTGGNQRGVYFSTGSQLKTTSGAISITGTGGLSSGNGNMGVQLGTTSSPAVQITTTGGSVNIIGTSSGTGSSQNNDGISVQLVNCASGSGAITLDGGIAHNSISSESLGFEAGCVFGHASSQSGSITFIGDVFWIASGTPREALTSGAVVFESKGNIFTIPLTYSNFTLTSNTSSLRFGKTTNTANVTLGSSINIAGPTTAYGGTLAINENITSSNGSTISLYSNILTFGSGKAVTSNNGQLIVAPLIASNSIGLAGATGTLSIPDSYFTSNFTDGFSNIQIGSSAQTGNITANTFTIRDNIGILTSGSLTLGGRSSLGNNNVTLGSGISSIIASASNYFQTNGTGVVNRTIAANGNYFLFPIGNALYNPVSIANNTSASDVFTSKVRDAVLDNGTSGNQKTDPLVNTTWDISKTNSNSGSGIDFIFQWESSQEANSINSFRLNHYKSSTSNWEFAAGASGSVVGSTTKTMTHTGYTGTFSPFAIGNNHTPLPIDLISFNATPNNNNVDLTWTTFGDNKNPFHILKSTDGNTWTSIGAQLPSENSVHYLFTDHKPAPVNYYQLSQLDHSNTLQYSDIRVVNFNSHKIAIFPNPNNGEFNIQSRNVLNYQIIDYTGKVIMEGDNSNPLIKTNLIKGIYLIKITEGEKTTFNKMIVQ